MEEQPEALRLADAIKLGWLENVDSDEADIDMIQAELRRLHGVEQERNRLKALNSELLEALKEIEWSNSDTWRTDRARTAIAKATGETQ